MEEVAADSEDLFFSVFGAAGLAGRSREYAAAGGDPAQIAYSAYTYDPQGSLVQPVSLYPDNGPVVRVETSSAYDAFGWGTTLTAGGTADPFSPVGFGGQHGYYRDYSGLYLLTHRYYDAGAGRFINRDPIGYKGGINLYGFAGNNPVNESDPSGLLPTSSLRGTSLIDPEGDKWYPQNWAQERARIINNWYATPERLEAVGQNILQIVRHLDNSQCGCSQFAGTIKSGPKPKGTGPHNNKIAERIEQLKKAHPNWRHEGGGDRTEETIRTPGGFKSSRRPDITFRRPDGTRYRENVGKTLRDGSPVTREKKALDDLERATGTRPTYTPYDR